MSSSSSFSYTWTPAQAPVARVSTSRTEIRDITIAYLVLTFDLVIILSGGGLLFGYGPAHLLSLISVEIVAIAAGAALTGFLFHELAHKVSAQRHGYWAEFRMSPTGLVFSVFTSIIGFLWAAPGATVISGMSQFDLRNWGRTSLAGPSSNAGFAAAFYASSLATFHSVPSVSFGLLFLAYINGLFGTFNMIPVGPLDGAKVLRWSRGTWLAGIVLIGAIAVTSYIALEVYGNPFL